MMKNIKAVFKGLLALTAVFLLGSCLNPFDPPSLHEDAPEIGGLQIFIGDGSAARTAFPRSNFSKYVISFSGPGTKPDHTVTDVSAPIKVDGLIAGDWDITVTAFMQIDGEEYPAASGSLSVYITGDYQPISIPISATKTSGQGYVRYTVSFPDGKATSGDLYITSIDGLTEKLHVENLHAAGAVNSGVRTVTGITTTPLPAGYYLARTELRNAYHQAGRVEIVHVYNNSETLLDWGFTGDDFVPFITVSGTIPSTIFDTVGGITSPNGVKVQLYKTQPTKDNLSGLQPFAETGFSSGSTWSVPIPSGLNTNVYFLLAHKNNHAGVGVNYYTATTSPSLVHVNTADASVTISAANAIIGSNYTPTATIGNVTITGTREEAITPVDVVVTLSGAYFNTIAADADLSEYVTGLPNGLQVLAKYAVNPGDTSITTTVSGTPTVASSAPIVVALPIAALLGTPYAVTTTTNNSAKYNIVNPTPKTLTVTGIPNEAKNRYYQVGLFAARDENGEPEGNPAAWNMGQVPNVNNPSVSNVPLYIPNEYLIPPTAQDDPWRGTGDFYVAIAVFTDSSYSMPTNYYITKVAKDFSGEPTTVPFSLGDSGTFDSLNPEDGDGSTSTGGGTQLPKKAYIESGGVFGLTTDNSIWGQIVLVIQGGLSFNGIGQGLDVSNFFLNLPPGLKATVSDPPSYSNDIQKLTIGIMDKEDWEPLDNLITVPINAPVQMQIPAVNLLGNEGAPRLVENTNNVLFAISTASSVLSGIIDLKVDSLPYSVGTDYGTIEFYTNPSRNGTSIIGAAISSVGGWSANLPSSLTGTLYAGLRLPDKDGTGGMMVPISGNHPAGSSPWAMGTQRYISVRGDVNDVKIGGIAVDKDRIRIQAYIPLGEDKYDQYIGDATIASDGTFQLILPEGFGPVTLGLNILEEFWGGVGVWESIYLGFIYGGTVATTPITVSTDRNLITLSGELHVSKNDNPITGNNILWLEARNTSDNNSDLGGIYPNVTTGIWSLLIPAVTGPRNVEVKLHFNDAYGPEYWDLDSQVIWTGSFTNSSFDIGPKTISYNILSGAIGTVTVNDHPSPYVIMVIPVDQANNLVSIGSMAGVNMGAWSTLTSKTSGQAQFVVGALDITSPSGYIVLSPPLASPQPALNASGPTLVGDLGNITIPIRNVVVTVKNGGTAIPAVVVMAKAALTAADFQSDMPYAKFWHFPMSQSVRYGTQTLPVHNSVTGPQHFVVMTANGNYYVTNTPVNTDTAVTLDIASSNMTLTGNAN
jgi:hypothetical protein